MSLRESDYYWYHTIDLPQHGRVRGHWELSNVREKFLGGIELNGKRILEAGAASGRVTLELEQAGGIVTALDIGGEFQPDFISYAPMDHTDFLRRLNNSHRLVREVFQLKAEFRQGTVYQPIAGQFDIGILGNILLHLRDPFKAIYNVARASKEKVVIVESLWNWPLFLYLEFLAKASQLPFVVTGNNRHPEQTLFIPTLGLKEQCVWWFLRPSLIKRMVALMGFEKSRIIYHHQTYEGKKSLQYTLVAERTGPGVLMQT
jgi:SAM-dependent methyltransferase